MITKDVAASLMDHGMTATTIIKVPEGNSSTFIENTSDNTDHKLNLLPEAFD